MILDQIRAAPFTQIFDCFISKCIKFACGNIFFKSAFPAFRIELKKPIF